MPGYHTITSPFGPRKSPTKGASSNHSGIDIAAPEGTTLHSITSGTISYVGFKGAGGHTITLSSNNLEISYCHVSPNYIVNVGDYIHIGNPIGNVGPKYLSYSPNTYYKDSSGRYTNGSTTGPHLHLTIKKDGIAVNPLLYFN